VGDAGHRLAGGVPCGRPGLADHRFGLNRDRPFTDH
jgi:hypothetical protein